MTIFSPDQVCPPVPPAGVRVPALPPLLQLRGGGGRGQGLPRQDLPSLFAAGPDLERHQVESNKFRTEAASMGGDTHTHHYDVKCQGTKLDEVQIKHWNFQDADVKSFPPEPQ